MAQCRTLVLSPEEWCRITNQVRATASDRAARTQMLREREEIRQRTQEISRDWPDTIHQRHERVLQEFEAAKRAKEEEQVLLDQQERELQEQKRKEVLERAQLLRFYNNDQVRKLNSALFYSDVLHERELQLELKRKNQPPPETFDIFTHSKLIEEESLSRRRCEAQKKKSMKEALMKQMEEKRSRERQEKILCQSIPTSNLLDAVEPTSLLHRKHAEDPQQKKTLCREELVKQIKINQNYEHARRYQEEEEARRADLYYEGQERLKCLLKLKNQNRIKVRQDRQEEVGRHLQALERANPVLEREELSRLHCQQQQDRLWEKRLHEEHCRRQHSAREREADYLKAVADQIRTRMKDKMDGADFRRETDEAIAYQLKEQERKRMDKLKQKKMVAQDLLRQIAEREELNNKESMTEEFDELRKEEEMIQRYAQELLRDRCGRQNVIPILQAARPGVGMGFGPPLPERGNIRPNYHSALEGLELLHRNPPAIAMRE